MWFAASVFYQYDEELPAGENALWEEVIILVEANSQDEAKSLAARHAKMAEVGYEVVNGKRLQRKFDTVVDVFEIPDKELVSGVELYSRFLKESEASSLKTKFAE
jgi:hypothetical protein